MRLQNRNDQRAGNTAGIDSTNQYGITIPVLPLSRRAGT